MRKINKHENEKKNDSICSVSAVCVRFKCKSNDVGNKNGPSREK